VVMSDGRFAGVDCASEEHAACVVDERGRIVEGRRYRHDEPGIRTLCSGLLRLRVALVALERPDGRLIGRLLDAGLAVIAVHPNQVKSMRLATAWRPARATASTASCWPRLRSCASRTILTRCHRAFLLGALMWLWGALRGRRVSGLAGRCIVTRWQ
jgi:Transposase